MMDKTSSKTSVISAWVIYFFNFIAMIICVLLFLFGIWIIASPATLSNMIEASGNATVKALIKDILTLGVGIAVSAVATFIFFISFMGIYGGITRSPFLLFMYAALIFLMLLLECALLFYFSSNIVEKGLQDDGQWTHAMRLLFKCCENSTIVPGDRRLPWSCCGPDTYPDNCTASLIFKKDCQTTIVAWLDKYQLFIYSSLAVLHVVLSSCSIMRRSHSHS